MSDGGLEEAGRALHAAARRCDLEEVRRVLAARPDAARWQDDRGRTAVFQSRHPPILEALLAAGLDIDAPDAGGSTILHRQCTTGGLDVIELLLRRGAKVDARDRDGWTPLHRAAAFIDVAHVKLLLAHGADPQARNRHGQAPIHTAIDDGSVVTARWLWEGPGPRDVHAAAALGEWTELGALLDRDPSLRDAPDGLGATPLHRAATMLQPRCVHALLARGAEPAPRDPRGWTPLHWAVYTAIRGAGEDADRASREVAEALLDGGADAGPRALDGKTPLDLAIAAGRRKPRTIAHLESRGARSTPIPGEER